MTSGEHKLRTGVLMLLNATLKVLML